MGSSQFNYTYTENKYFQIFVTKFCICLPKKIGIDKEQFSMISGFNAKESTDKNG